MSPTTPAGGEATQTHGLLRVALLGNPNTGKTTLFNRLSGLRHKTSNFPGTTQEARLGFVRGGWSRGDDAQAERIECVELIDLPGIYSLELAQSEAEICRRVLAGTLSPAGEAAVPPEAVCVVLDATNLARNLLLAGEVLRRRLPTLIVLNMIDLARKRGLHVDVAMLEERLGCRVLQTSARTGEGMGEIMPRLASATIPNRTPPGTQEGLEAWADEIYTEVSTAHDQTELFPPDARGTTTLTDRLDHVLTHPVLGPIGFVLIMTGLFWTIFSLASIPMDLIEAIFSGNDAWVAAWQPEWLSALTGGGLTGLVNHVMPPGLIRELLAEGVVSGIGATVIFVPQIVILFFLISVLEDTGYLARAAFVMDRVLRPFGLPGHAFVPLLSSHACALPGIMAARGVPDRRERLATILVAPFMSCSARIPVYVLLTALLFPGQPGMQALAFTGCYALGAIAGLLSAALARRTLLRGPSRPMALELPTYKWPSLYTATVNAIDRGVFFLRKAGTNILLVCVALWWLSAFPHVEPPTRAMEIRAQAAGEGVDEAAAADLLAEADRLEASHARASSFIGRMGRAAQPAFEPLGYDWQLTVGVLASFAAREVFVSTMSVVIAGEESTDVTENQTLLDRISGAVRDDGKTPVFKPGTAWSLLVFFVLAMQCLPTLVVTAREAGGVKWALLQLGWMSTLAYLGALIVRLIAS